MATICRLSACFRNVFLKPPSMLRCKFSTTATRLTANRSYTHALELLEKLQSNRKVVQAVSDTSRDMNLDAMPEMIAWTRKAGYEVEEFAKHGLKCIHVAGTKGKGSVCVMAENILLQYHRNAEHPALRNIGLYTSPHLVHVRERIRINGSPITEDLFTRYFFELWDRLSHATTTGNQANLESPETKPAYFRYLTLLALHTFVKEGVETAIVECGIGGEYDSTNILPAEAVTVTGITALAIDHAGMLGNTIEDIAWHKAGIMKIGVPAFTVKQDSKAQAVLDTRANEKSVSLSTVDRLSALESGQIELGLEGDFQKDNASLAIALVATHLGKVGAIRDMPTSTSMALSQDSLPPEFIKGLETTTWPGRCQHIKDGNKDWFIDGAHTTESIVAAAQWYTKKFHEANTSRRPSATMLIFNQQDRDARSLLLSLLSSLDKREVSPAIGLRSSLFPYAHSRPFTYAAFCTNELFKPQVAGKIDISLQKDLEDVYGKDQLTGVHVACESVEEAVEHAYSIAQDEERILVFVTGSLYLVGCLLQVLEKKGVDTSASS